MVYTLKMDSLAGFISIFQLSDLNMCSLCISAGFKDIEQAHNPCGLQRRTFDYMEESTEDGCKNSFCTLGGNVSIHGYNECGLFQRYVLVFLIEKLKYRNHFINVHEIGINL